MDKFGETEKTLPDTKKETENRGSAVPLHVKVALLNSMRYCLDEGVHYTFYVKLLFEVIELIKEMAYQNHKTQAEVIVDLVKAANKVRRP